MIKIPLPSLASQPDVIKCKHCGSTQVRPSHKSSGNDTHVTYRCQACKRHFRVGSGVLGGLGIKPLLIGGSILAAVAITIGISLLGSSPADVPFKAEIETAKQDQLKALHSEVKKGDPQAQYDLGRTHWINAEYQQAFPLIKAAADKGHVEATYQVGLAYLSGLGTLQNYRSALEYFTKSAELGHMDAEYRLGLLYRDGLATPPNKEAAYLWLNIAAARGHEDALLYRDKLAAVMSSQELHRAQEASAQTNSKLPDAIAKTP
jgi:DNA-directed RNA polymerase subunit RPC12/RpoP